MKSEPRIFTKTIRMHPFRDYSAIVSERLSTFAPKGTLKVHSLEKSVSYEPAAMPLKFRTQPEAMLCALETVDIDWTRNVGSPLYAVPQP